MKDKVTPQRLSETELNRIWVRFCLPHDDWFAPDEDIQSLFAHIAALQDTRGAERVLSAAERAAR